MYNQYQIGGNMINKARSIMISEEMDIKIKKLAKEKCLTVNSIIRLAISEFIERNENDKKRD